jgi:hypothetical protein
MNWRSKMNWRRTVLWTNIVLLGNVEDLMLVHYQESYNIQGQLLSYSNEVTRYKLRDKMIQIKEN